MSKVKHISFEELAGNLAEILNTVRAEHTSVVVEYASGEKLLIKPFSPSHLKARKDQSEGAAPVADESTLQQQPSNQVLDPDNVSAVGAMYEIDPNSITPG
jgi:hypothetical protein